MKFVNGRLLAVATLTLALAACGSKAPRPTAEIAMTDAALQAAVLAGAREHAPIELRQAQEKKDAADLALQREEYGKARRLTDEARVDAEVARAKAESEKTRLALSESEGNINMMREEVKRTSGE